MPTTTEALLLAAAWCEDDGNDDDTIVVSVDEHANMRTKLISQPRATSPTVCHESCRLEDTGFGGGGVLFGIVWCIV